MDEQAIKILLEKYNAGLCTAEEKALLETWYLKYNQEIPHGLSGEKLEQATGRIWARLEQSSFRGRIIPFIRYAVAASVVIALGFGGYYLLRQKPAQQLAYHNDVAPGHNQATLTLANGKKIILIKGLKGTLAVQGGTTIQADANTISYQAGKEEQVSYNTLTTVRGEQSPYPLVLADGTKVWLNAQSSITFPTAFNQKDRIVKLTGEAYFEVAHNAKQPFKVETNGQTIEDIGTAFDVNAYTDEPATKTTLIEGSIKVNKLILKPGEQTDGLTIRQVDTETATAWKDGLFMFEENNLDEIMRKLTRWYDVEVVFKDNNLKRKLVSGSMSRFGNISEVLRKIETTDRVHFEINGKKVTVSNPH